VEGKGESTRVKITGAKNSWGRWVNREIESWIKLKGADKITRRVIKSAKNKQTTRKGGEKLGEKKQEMDIRGEGVMTEAKAILQIGKKTTGWAQLCMKAGAAMAEEVPICR